MSNVADSVAIAYFDSSALVKLVVDEVGSDLVAELWDGCDVTVSSRLAYPEVHAALAAAERNRQIDAQGLRNTQESWEMFWSAIRPVELTETVEQHAGRLTGLHALRGADAVHLASALMIGSPDLLVVVWDRRLRAGVIAEGLAIAPAGVA